MRKIVNEWFPPPEGGFVCLDEIAKMFDTTPAAVKAFIKDKHKRDRPEVVMVSVKNRRMFYWRDDAMRFMQQYGARRRWNPPTSLDAMPINKAAKVFNMLESDVELVFSKYNNEAPKAIVVDINTRRAYYRRKELLAFLAKHSTSKDPANYIYYSTYRSDAIIIQFAKNFCKPKVTQCKT